jgi:hypothetical protein
MRLSMRIDQALFYLCSGHQVPGGYSAGLLDVSAAAGERGGRVGNKKPTQKNPLKMVVLGFFNF